LKRLPQSRTVLRKECLIPFRLDLTGGWLDQPYVSKYYPGPVITISIEPDFDFNDRSGMSSSTRAKAIELWQTDIPEGACPTLFLNGQLSGKLTGPNLSATTIVRSHPLLEGAGGGSG
jgi:hypothetical protein